MIPRTRDQLVASARQRADMQNSAFIDTDEAMEMLQQSWHELYDLLIEAYGENYFSITQDQTAVAGVATFGLDTLAAPDQFYKLVRVGFVVGDYEFPIEREDRRQVRSATPQSWGVFASPTFAMEGTVLRWQPPPSSTMALRVTWVPMAPSLHDPSGPALPFQAQPWEEYLVVDWAIKGMQKEESDVGALMAQKGALIERIRKMSPRDIGSPERIACVPQRAAPWGWGGWT